MRKITTMPMLNANLSTEFMKMRGAQRAGIILALACFLMLASSAGAQFTPLCHNFGKPTLATRCTPTILDSSFRAAMGTSTALPTMEEPTMQVQCSRSLLRDKSPYFTVLTE